MSLRPRSVGVGLYPDRGTGFADWGHTVAKTRRDKNTASRLQTAGQAVAVAEAYQMETLGTLMRLNSSPDIAPLLTQIAPWLQDGGFTGEDKARLIRSLGPDGHAIVNTLQEALLTADRVLLWLQHRVVYRVYPELAESLRDTEPGTPIPCEVLRRLPHPDPFIAFPTPIPAPPPLRRERPLAKPPVYVGMLVTGLTNELTLCSTADPRLHMLTVALVGRVKFIGASEPNYPSYGIEIPCTAKQFTIDEMIEGHLAMRGSSADTTELDLSAYRLAVSLLLYLCSDRRDMSAGTEVRGRPKKRRVPAASTVVDVGFDIGPKLFAARKETSETSAESGKRVRSHIRRAHWHTYWTGPREQPTPDVRWLHPILVHPTERNASRSVVIEDGPREQQ